MPEPEPTTNPGTLRVVQGGKRKRSLLRTARDVMGVVVPLVAAAWTAFSWVQGRLDRLEGRMDTQFHILRQEIRGAHWGPYPRPEPLSPPLTTNTEP